MADRFFRATALCGRLHLIDLADWESWEPRKIQYRDQVEVQWLVRASGGERRVIRTVAELHAAISESVEPRAVYLYVHDSLLDATRRCWEDLKQVRAR